MKSENKMEGKSENGEKRKKWENENLWGQIESRIPKKK